MTVRGGSCRWKRLDRCRVAGPARLPRPLRGRATRVFVGHVNPTAARLPLLLLVAATLSVVLTTAAPPEPASAADCSITHGNVSVGNNPNQAGAIVNYAAPTTSGAACGTVTC